ncbi:MAG: hypothetical protein LCH41_01520 [Armatimonadetes bacterium]|nr:hypothetical protein [Armatimonadota bacterium]
MKGIRQISGRLKRGFTLLESTIALYTLLMGVLTFASMAVLANKVGLQSKIRTNAYQVANQQLESIASTSFENLTVRPETSFDIPGSVITSLPGGRNTKYEVQGLYQVQEVNTTMKRISTRVRWRNATTPEGRTAPWSEVRLATVVVRPGSVTAGPIDTP